MSKAMSQPLIKFLDLLQISFIVVELFYNI